MNSVIDLDGEPLERELQNTGGHKETPTSNKPTSTPEATSTQATHTQAQEEFVDVLGGYISRYSGIECNYRGKLVKFNVHEANLQG